MTHICISKLTTIASDNGLSPGRRQAIIWTNAGILLIGHLGTNFSENLLQTYTVSFNKINLKMSSGKWQPFCLGLNVLKCICFYFLTCQLIAGSNSTTYPVNCLEYLTSFLIGWMELCSISLFLQLQLSEALKYPSDKSNCREVKV